MYNNFMEKLDKYIEELKTDLSIERFSLDEKTLKVPAIKAKWLARLSSHKREYRKYEKLLSEAKAKLMKEYETKRDISYTKATLEKIILDEDVIIKIQDNINFEKNLIEFCDKALSLAGSMSYDIKNIIEWTKLELT